MNILIIEDDDFKFISLRNFIGTNSSNSKIFKASSLAEATQSVLKMTYDYILIDMAIPSHGTSPGEGSSMSLLSGGLQILLELKYLERQDKCIIVTQYPEIEVSGEFVAIDNAAEIIGEKIGYDVLACIKYIEGSDCWEKKLSELII